MAIDPITAGLDFANSLVSRFFPDKTQEEKDSLAAQMQVMVIQSDMFKQAAGIVEAEAESKSWLAASWRPITMLTFTGLIVARWFGWAAPNLAEAEYLKLWDIVQLGLGGYVIGRSAEKIAPHIATAISNKG